MLDSGGVLFGTLSESNVDVYHIWLHHIYISTVRYSEPHSDSFMFHILRPHLGLLSLTALRICLELTGFGKENP